MKERPIIFSGPMVRAIIEGRKTQARACDVEWIRAIVQQCQGASVPVFVKQLGARPWVDLYTEDPELEEWSREHERCVWNPDGLGKIGGVEAISKWDERDGQPRPGAVIEVGLRSRKGSEVSEWPEDLRVREMPGGAA